MATVTDDVLYGGPADEEADMPPDDLVLLRLDELIVEGKQRESKQRRRMSVLLVSSVLMCAVGLGVFIGGLFLSRALGDVSHIVKRSDSILHQVDTNGSVQQCRAEISGAYSALESTRDNNGWLAALANAAGDQTETERRKDATRAAAIELDKLPPRGDAYRDGVTIDGVHYRPCEG